MGVIIYPRANSPYTTVLCYAQNILCHAGVILTIVQTSMCLGRFCVAWLYKHNTRTQMQVSKAWMESKYLHLTVSHGLWLHMTYVTLIRDTRTATRLAPHDICLVVLPNHDLQPHYR